MRMKEESEKAGLKLNIQKTKIMDDIQSHYFMVNRWGNNGNSDRIYFLGLQNTASMKLRHLLLERKAMTNLDNILKSKDIILPT